MKYLLLTLAIFLFGLNFTSFNIVENDDVTVVRKKYDPSLTRLNSLNKIEAYTDSVTSLMGTLPGSLEYAIAAEDIIGKRFYHKYATQDIDENFIASVTQKITGLFVSSKITSDDILTKPYGYCGQQNTVLMELLLRKKHNYRVVYFLHHFAIESFIDGHWYYFDTYIEHQTFPRQRMDGELLKNLDSFAVAYNETTDKITSRFGKSIGYRLGKINEVQGAHAQFFQEVTRLLSRISFLFPILWLIYFGVRDYGKKEQPLKKKWYWQRYFDLEIFWPGLTHAKQLGRH